MDIKAQNTDNRFGATPGDWLAFDMLAELTGDLLPVVSRPDATISPGSSIKGIGKVPSRYNRDGNVVGFKDWTKYEATTEDVGNWEKNPDYGICLQTRQIRALDVDVTDPTKAAEIEAVIARYLPGLPKRIRSNSAKFLIAFRLDGEYPKRRFSTSDTDAIEFLGNGQQFIAAGTHPSGVRYEWADGTPIKFPEVDPDAFEALWGELLATFAVSKESRDSGKARRVGVDMKIDDPVAGFLRSKNLVLGEAPGKLHVACPWSAEHTGGSDGDSSTTWFLAGTNGHPVGHFDCRHSHCAGRNRNDYLAAIGYDAGDANVFDTLGEEFDARIDRSDAGNANLIAQLTDGNLRFVYETKAWILWDGEGWIPDETGSRAYDAARDVADHYFDQAIEILKDLGKPGLSDSDEKRIKKTAESVKAWAQQCRNKGRLDAMIALASKDRRIQISFTELDRDPFLLGVSNGVVDLRTGQLRAASRDEFVTKRSSYAYNPQAPAVRWNQFIDEITGSPVEGRVDDYVKRPGLAAYLQKAIGYSLTGSTAEQKMFIAHGKGSNGKNVIIDMVTRLFGEQILTINPEVLMASKFDADGERATPAARQLAGVRMAVCAESKRSQQLDVATVKKHTGGGFFSARGLHQAPITFEITHKVWLMTNGIPTLDHMDDAIRGRLHLIPFDRRWNRPGVPERNENLPDGDKNLPLVLAKEAEGILAWVVAGAARYCQEGLDPPDEVRLKTTNYFQQEDGFNAWLDGMQRVDNPLDGMLAGVAFASYESYCYDHGREGAGISQTAFGRRLKMEGVHSKKSGSIYYAIRER